MFGVIGLVGEIKVTHLIKRGEKYVVCSHRDDDPELLQGEDVSLVEADDRSTTYSFDTGISLGAAIKLDGVQKWRAGLSKALVHLQSSFEFCGTRLGFVIVGLLFSRIVVSGDDTFIIECSEEYLESSTTRTMTATEFLDEPRSWTHLTWNLCDSSDAEAPRWAAEGMRRYLDLHRTAVQVLTSHSASHGGNPFRPLGSLSPSAQLVSQEITGPITVPHNAAARTGILETSRPKASTRRQEPKSSEASASTSVADKSNTPDSKRKRKRSATALPQRAEPKRSLPSTRDVTNKTDTSTSAAHSRKHVERWRAGVAAHDAASPYSEAQYDTSMASVGSEEVHTPPYIPDSVFDAALDAADMKRATVDVTPESPCSACPEADESLQCTTQDLLDVIAARGSVIHLVSSAQMDRLVAAIGAGCEG